MIAALALLLTGTTAPDIQTYTVDGVERKAMVVARSKPNAKAPLVLAFHGHGGSMRQAHRSFDVHTLWPEALVIYPDGLPTKGRTDPEGKRQGWQKNAGEYEDRDLKLVDAIMAHARKDYQVDDKRIYAMGHSNGGRFTYVLWAERGAQFAAFGPSGSPATGLLYKMEPRSAFLVAGENDKLVAFEGQRLTFEALRRKLGTHPAGPGSTGLPVRYEKSSSGLELGTYFHPGGHEYPSVAATLTVELFKRHEKR